MAEHTIPDSVVPHDPAASAVMEILVYLAVVQMALMISLEKALNANQEVLLLWGSALGLTFAHLFAFRLAEVYDEGLALGAGWRPIGAMFGAAIGLAAATTVPYLLTFDRFDASSIAVAILMAVVAVSAYLAARNRGAVMWVRLVYASVGVVLGLVLALIKHSLTH